MKRLSHKRELLKKDGLDEIICRLEQIANNRFCLKDKEWNLLLSFRDKLKKHIEKNYL